MMTINKYNSLKSKVIESGYQKEIDWAKNVKPVNDIDTFFGEYCWVVINSGMKNQVARKIWNKIQQTGDFHTFKHEGKVKAMLQVKQYLRMYFESYMQADDKLTYLESMPFIGKVTKYHLAKNYGLDFCKPDRHLERIAKKYNTTPFGLCNKLAIELGERIGVIDLVIWRAANLGFI